MAQPPSPSRSLRRRVLAGAAVGWVVIVVAGAGSTADDALLGVDNIDTAWAIIFATLVLLSLAFFIYLNPFRSEWTPPPRRKGRMGPLIVAGAILAFLVWRPELLENLGDEDEEQDLADAFTADVDVTPNEAAPETVAQATDLMLLLVGLAVLAGVWFWLRRRNVDDSLNEEDADLALEKDLLQALEQASMELGASGDPRTAVLRSYAVLETVLATQGSARTAAETPTEHLRKSLRYLRIDAEPLMQLGRLYEIARFSEHPITVSQQHAAARALDRARFLLGSLA